MNVPCFCNREMATFVLILKIARAKTIDKVEPVPEVFFVSWTKSLINCMSVDAWAIWGIVSFIAADCISLLLYIFKTSCVEER